MDKLTSPAAAMPFGSREEWLKARRRIIGASEAPALVGVHPFLSRYALWAEKTGRLPPPEPNDPVLLQGELFEDDALELMRRTLPDWEIVPNPIPPGLWFVDEARRMGATPDGFASRPDREGQGTIQVKVVSPGSFRRRWRGEEGDTEVPAGVLIQANIERALAGAAWCCVAALEIGDGGVRLHVIDVEVVDGLVDRIADEVCSFWRDVESNTPPSPDYDRDLSVVKRIFRDSPRPDPINLDDDAEFIEALRTHVDAAAHIKAMETARDRAQTLIRERIGDHEAATAAGFHIRCKTIPRKGYTVAAGTTRPVKITAPTEED